jgi:hypothetical protein
MLMLSVEEVKDERVTDTEAVEERVKGCVVPMAVVDRLGTKEREAPEGLTPMDGLGEGLKDPVTLMVRELLGEPVPLAERHSVGETEGEDDTEPTILRVRVNDTVTEAEEERDSEPLAVKEEEALRETLMVRLRLRVTQPEAELEEVRHSEGVTDGLRDAVPVRLTVPLTE